MAVQRARATIKDVARIAGVSSNTVSLVVRDSPLVKPSTKEHVRTIIDSLGYRPHAAAAALRSTRSRTLGFFLMRWGYTPADDYTPDSDDICAVIDVFRSQMLNAMTEGARVAGYYLLIDTFCDVQACQALFDSARIDGALVDMLSDETTMKALHARGVPFVVVGRDAAGLPVSWVKADEEAGAYAATRHLLALGHKALGVVSAGPEEHVIVQQRLQGYQRALTEAQSLDVQSAIAMGDWSFQSGYNCGLTLLRNAQERPTAIFVLSEIMAAGVLRAADELGIHVPADLSVATVEDSPWVEYTKPKLTAVHVPMYQVGLRATEMLLSLLESGSAEPQHVTLPTALVVRESTAPPPRGR